MLTNLSTDSDTEPLSSDSEHSYPNSSTTKSDSKRRVRLVTMDQFQQAEACQDIKAKKGTLIGGGASASVYTFCPLNDEECNDNPSQVLRVTKDDDCNDYIIEQLINLYQDLQPVTKKGLAPIYYEVVKCGQSCYTLMEYVRGDTFYRWMEDPKRIDLGRQLVFEAIKTLHKIRSVGHGDLNPNNIILGKKGNLIVDLSPKWKVTFIDFGPIFWNRPGKFDYITLAYYIARELNAFDEDFRHFKDKRYRYNVLMALLEETASYIKECKRPTDKSLREQCLCAILERLPGILKALEGALSKQENFDLPQVKSQITEKAKEFVEKMNLEKLKTDYDKNLENIKKNLSKKEQRENPQNRKIVQNAATEAHSFTFEMVLKIGNNAFDLRKKIWFGLFFES